jgi:hypothetical protein
MRKKWATGLALPLGLLGLGTALFLANLEGAQRVVIARGNAGPLGDPEAITLSGAALQQTVRDFPNCHPSTYDGTHFYARNIYDENNGYVLWRLNTDPERGFTVHMTVSRSNVLCEVCQFK